MPSPLNQPLSSGATRSGNILKTWLPIILFGVLWADLIRQLSYEWAAREQYAYGWFVPFFAAALLWRRWLDRPAPSQPAAFSFQLSPFNFPWPVKSSAREVLSLLHRATSLGLLSAFCFLLCLLLLPTRVIYEINPDWPLVSWLYTLIVVGGTLYAFWLAGGLSWTRHFAFPVAFILVAVVWPYRIEKALTQNLMQVVAGLTVELLGWLDVPALHHGNLIELSTGVVGVDEACSGIRSFQSSLMAALLMGELYRLRALPRLGLVACGLGLAFMFNVVRTLLLSWQVSQHGLAILEKWHDPAGMTIAVACFFALWAIAVLLKRKWSTSPLPSPLRLDSPRPSDGRGIKGEGSGESDATLAHRMGEGLGVRVSGEVSPSSPLSPREMTSSPISLGPLSPREMAKQPISPGPLSPREMTSSPISPGPLPNLQPCRTFLLAVGCWAILCLVATEVWYRSHTVKDAGVFHWTVALPENKPGFQKIELPPRTLNLLAFDAGGTSQWKEDDGSEFSLSFFRWNPRSVQSVIYSRIHRPEVCLPASGYKQLTESELVFFDAGRFKLPFRKYTYASEGQILYVFFCQWEDGAETQTGMGASGQTERLRAVWVGRRLVGQQTLEIIVTGSPSLAEAEALVRRRLPELIRPDAAQSQPNRVSGRAP